MSFTNFPNPFHDSKKISRMYSVLNLNSPFKMVQLSSMEWLKWLKSRNFGNYLQRYMYRFQFGKKRKNVFRLYKNAKFNKVCLGLRYCNGRKNTRILTYSIKRKKIVIRWEMCPKFYRFSFLLQFVFKKGKNTVYIQSTVLQKNLR